MSPGVPYVSVRSNDVLNGSLDLVLRLCTRADTVWRTLRPFKEGENFPSVPLLLLVSLDWLYRDTDVSTCMLTDYPRTRVRVRKGEAVVLV